MTNFLKIAIFTITAFHFGFAQASQETWIKKSLIIWACPNFKHEIPTLKKAAKKWSKVTGLELTVTHESKEKADIKICFITSLSQLLVTKIAHAEAEVTTVGDNIIVRAEIFVNGITYNWKRRRRKFKKVLLHELGHALGFDHRKTYYSVMNPHSPHFRIFKKDKQIARKRYKHILKR